MGNVASWAKNPGIKYISTGFFISIFFLMIFPANIPYTAMNES